VEDGLGNIATATVTVTVNGLPFGDPVALTTAAGAPVTVDVVEA